MISIPINDSIIPRRYVASLETWAALKYKARRLRWEVTDFLRYGSMNRSNKFLAVMLALADGFDAAAEEIDRARINVPPDTTGLPF